MENNRFDYELYLKEREFFTNSLADGARSFDKTVLTLSSGAFAISITFIKDVVRVAEGNTEWEWTLIMAWAMFGLSILVTLASFLTSQDCCLKKICYIDGAAKNQQNTDPVETNSIDYRTMFLNKASYAIFAIGIIFLTLFSGRNLFSLKEQCMAIKKTAGIVSPPTASNGNPKGEKITLTNGLPTPPVTSFAVRHNDGIVSPPTVSDRIQSQTQQGSIPQNAGGGRGKGIVTPPAVSKPVPPTTDQSSGKK